MMLKYEKLFAPVDKIEIGNQMHGVFQLIKLMLFLPIEMFTDSFAYSGVGLANTMLCAGIRSGKDYLFGNYENKDDESAFAILTADFTQRVGNLPEYLEQEYAQFSISHFLADHMEELKTGALTHLALKNIVPENIYNNINGFDDKFKIIDIEIPANTISHDLHMTYDFSHKGAHFEHSIISPPLCILYENKPLAECLSVYVKEPIEHAMFAIEAYKCLLLLPLNAVAAIGDYTATFVHPENNYDEL